jgi:hypothetical protein
VVRRHFADIEEIGEIAAPTHPLASWHRLRREHEEIDQSANESDYKRVGSK